MKRFRFRLDPVLRVRRTELDRSETLVAATLRTLEQADEARRVVRERGTAEAGELSRDLAAGTDGAAARLRADGIEHQWREVAAGDARVAEHEERLAERRAGLIAARRHLRVVERLRERALERHRLAEARAEQRALDDATACLRARAGQGRMAW